MFDCMYLILKHAGGVIYKYCQKNALWEFFIFTPENCPFVHFFFIYRAIMFWILVAHITIWSEKQTNGYPLWAPLTLFPGILIFLDLHFTNSVCCCLCKHVFALGICWKPPLDNYIDPAWRNGEIFRWRIFSGFISVKSMHSMYMLEHFPIVWTSFGCLKATQKKIASG